MMTVARDSAGFAFTFQYQYIIDTLLMQSDGRA
jgi:hypothetical protein